MELTPEIYRRIVMAKLYIDGNYQQRIDLHEISRRAFLSKFHFHRLFRRIYHRTPHQYLTQKRLGKARELLEKNKTVTEVCSEVGFESMGSFSILFKKEIGFTPQYYRNLAYAKKQEAASRPKTAIPHCFIEKYALDRQDAPGKSKIQ